MANTVAVPIVDGALLTADFQDLYTVEASITRVSIDAVVINNYSTANATVTIRLISDGVGSEAHEVVTERTIRAKDSYLPVEMVGQGLATGGTIQAKASDVDCLNIRVTGTKIQ